MTIGASSPNDHIVTLTHYRDGLAGARCSCRSLDLVCLSEAEAGEHIRGHRRRVGHDAIRTNRRIVW